LTAESPSDTVAWMIRWFHLAFVPGLLLGCGGERAPVPASAAPPSASLAAPVAAPAEPAKTGEVVPDASARRQAALRDAAEFGRISPIGGPTGFEPECLSMPDEPDWGDASEAIGSNFGGGGPSVPRSPRFPGVTIATAIESGPASAELRASLASSNATCFRHCYATGLRRNPRLEGRVSVRFTIAPDGSVSGASADRRAHVDDEVVQCMTNRIGKVVFPASPDKVTVISVLQLSPGNPGAAAPPKSP